MKEYNNIEVWSVIYIKTDDEGDPLKDGDDYVFFEAPNFDGITVHSKVKDFGNTLVQVNRPSEEARLCYQNEKILESSSILSVIDVLHKEHIGREADDAAGANDPANYETKIFSYIYTGLIN